MRDSQKSAQKLGSESNRKVSSAAGVSPTHVFHIFHDDMHLKPYKFYLWHKLEGKDLKKG